VHGFLISTLATLAMAPQVLLKLLELVMP